PDYGNWRVRRAVLKYKLSLGQHTVKLSEVDSRKAFTMFTESFASSGEGKPCRLSSGLTGEQLVFHIRRPEQEQLNRDLLVQVHVSLQFHFSVQNALQYLHGSDVTYATLLERFSSRIIFGGH